MNLEIFSDLICPWCFIGKRRLDQALESGVGDGVNVIWRAYQLYPGMPVEGMDRREFARLRYGDGERSVAQSAQRSQLEEIARVAGINMDFSKAARMPNTFAGHRLLRRAREFGVQHELADSLFSAYFEQGRDLGDPAVLAEIASRHGIPAAAEYLASEEGETEVRRELERAEAIGVSGVPCFIFAGAFALPGAQEADVIGQFIERAKSKAAERTG